jgi:Ca2+-binding EF-hand superfamily protein
MEAAAVRLHDVSLQGCKQPEPEPMPEPEPEPTPEPKPGLEPRQRTVGAIGPPSPEPTEFDVCLQPVQTGGGVRTTVPTVDVLEIRGRAGQGRGVVGVVSAAGATAQQRLDCAISRAYEVLDVGRDGHVDVAALAHGFEMLGLHFTHAEAETLMREFDQDASGTLERSEFAAMIAKRLSQPPLLDFSVTCYAATSLFLLDAIPWGRRSVSFRPQQISVRATYSACNIAALAESSSVSIEVQRAIYMHVRTGPFAFTGVWIYVLESLVIFCACSGVRLARGNGGPSVWLAIPPACWVVLRVLVLLRRRRAQVALRVLGNPHASRLQTAKDAFPVPLKHANDVVNAFLHVKGVRPADATRSFHKKTRGFGVCPSAGPCAGYNRLTLGQRHFLVEKVSGGGSATRADSGHWLADTTQLAGVHSVVTWIHLRKQGKDLLVHLSLLCLVALITGLLAGIIAVFMPKCDDRDTCQLLSVQNDAAVRTTAGSTLHSGARVHLDVSGLGGRCHPSCLQMNCSALAAQCAQAPPPCFSFSDGHCDEPVLCPVGSDFGDCNASSLSSANNVTSVRAWLQQYGLQGEASTVEAYIGQAAVNGLSALRAADAAQLLAALPDVDASTRAKLQTSLSQLQTAPTTIKDWMAGLGLAGATDRVNAFLNSAPAGVQASQAAAAAASAGGVVFDEIDSLRTVDKEELLRSISLDAASEAQLRAALGTLQAAPSSVEAWLVAQGLHNHQAAVEGYLKQNAATLQKIEAMSVSTVDSMLASLQFDTERQQRFKSAMFALRQSGSAALAKAPQIIWDQAQHAAEAVRASTTRWLSGLDSKLCKFQHDGVCDEPLRCPLLTDSLDCDAEERGHNVMGAYSAYLRRKSTPHLASIAAAISDDYHVSCPYVRATEACGGCVASSNASSCAPGGTGMYTSVELCRRVRRSEKLHTVARWCDRDIYRDPWDLGQVLTGEKPPCECLAFWQHFVPEWVLIFFIWFCIWMPLSTMLTLSWCFRLRSTLQLGAIGVDTSIPDNAASVRVNLADMEEIAPLILRHKLGRSPRIELLKSWKRSLCCSNERLDVLRDHIELHAVNKFPLCCHCCRQTHTEDAYHVLLKDIHFIETGTDTDPLLRTVGKACLLIGLGFHLSTFLEMFLVQYNARQDSNEGLVGSTTKLVALGVSIFLFVGMYFAAGLLKKDFVHIGVHPDEFSRGSRSPYAGNSPFFLRMGLACTSKSNQLEPFQTIVKLIRSAVAESRQLDNAKHVSQVAQGLASQTPNHLSHLAHHPNAALFALQWAVRIRRKTATTAKQSQRPSGLPQLEEHDRRAVSNWIRAHEAASLQVKCNDIDRYLEEITAMAAGTSEPVQQHKEAVLREALTQWVTTVEQEKHVAADNRGELLAQHWEFHRQRKEAEDEKRSRQASEITHVKDKHTHRMYHALEASDAFVRSGTLLKLGGIRMHRWEARRVELTDATLSWTSLKHQSGLSINEIDSVDCAEDVEGKPSFTVFSRVKNNKQYHIIAKSIEDRDAWVASIASMIKGELQVVRHGTLLKLGGRQKDVWGQRVFTARPTGLMWGAKCSKEKNMLHCYEMVSVEATGGSAEFGFAIATNIKNHKTYSFRAYHAAAREQWIAALNSVINTVEVYKDGVLCKLGGKGKNKYSERRVQISNKGMSWAPLSTNGVGINELAGAHATQDIGGKPSFIVTTTTKASKTYQLVASSVDERDTWLVAVQALADGSFSDALARKGTLMKLGGLNKDMWEERNFTVSMSGGLSWSSRSFNDISVSPAQVLSVNELSRRAGELSPNGLPACEFEVKTTAKDNKTYRFSCSTEEERSEWVEAIEQLLGAGSRKVTDRKIKLDLRVLNKTQHAVEFQGTNLKLDFVSQTDESSSESMSRDKLVQLALFECFSTFDTNRSGYLTLEELSDALECLGLNPTHDELAWMVSEYAVSEDGSLSKEEFVAMMQQYIDAGEHPQLEYEGHAWCPINLLSLDFDFLPWGKNRTEFKAAQIDVVANEGLGGLPATASKHNLSRETEKTRWLHMEGNPAPAWKLNAYFAEALAVYSLPWESVFGSGTHVSWVAACSWWLLRTLYFFFRRRGIGQLYTFGNPTVQDNTDRFAVPIRMLSATTDAFLHLKGVSPLDRSDTFEKNFPGLGVLPVGCGCYAEHSITIGERHFKMSRASNNRRSFSRGCSRTDYFCGLIEDANWLAIHKEGKDCCRLLGLIGQAFMTVFMLTLLVASQTYSTNCEAQLSMTSDDWQKMGIVGRTDWCEQYRDSPLDNKPGRPCVCYNIWTSGDAAAAEQCNPVLDPIGYDASEDADDESWCRQWSHAAEDWAWIIHTDQPCECLWFFQRFQWRLLILIDTVVLGVLTLSILYVWLLVTPIWLELGIGGVDNRAMEHIAAVRIDRQNRQRLPLIFLQRKLGRAIVSDTPDDGGDVLYRWRYKRVCYRCTTGMRQELVLHRDYLHLHARSGIPVCFCSCHALNCCLKMPVNEDDFYVSAITVLITVLNRTIECQVGLGGLTDRGR